MSRPAAALLLAVVLALSGAGCGKKAQLAAPEGEQVRFPRAYPR